MISKFISLLFGYHVYECVSRMWGSFVRQCVKILEPNCWRISW